MKSIVLLRLVILFTLCIFTVNLSPQTPLPLINIVGDTLNYSPTALWNQMYNPGTNSVTSQNFEITLDNYDSFAADQFGLMDAIWSVTRVEVRGVYFGGTGTAESVNVWFYSDSAGLPNQVIHSSLNVIPTVGLNSGSFSIPLSEPVNLVEGFYWVCVQANMPFNSSGQWGWTTSTSYFFYESVWKNPGSGFGSVCTEWNYRVLNCGIGTAPGLCFALIGDIIPVELTSFTAISLDNTIKLDWQTATELNNSGFNVERKFTNGDWATIGFVKGNGTTTEPNDYTYIDKNIIDEKYFYRLKQIDYDGSFNYSQEVEVDYKNIFNFSLEQNYPNPFNPYTRIWYRVSSISQVTLKVYDVLGNIIATLVDEYKPAGVYEVEFNTLSTNHHTSSGVYFYQLKIVGPEINSVQVQTKKMVYTK